LNDAARSAAAIGARDNRIENRWAAPAEWLLDSRFTFLNHGSYGATPRKVLAEQNRLRRQMENHPGDFFLRLPQMLRQTADRLAHFLGGAGKDYVFVDNATTGCNAVLASLPFSAKDEILINDHIYPAVRNAVRRVAERTGAQVVEAQVPFPIFDSQVIIEAVAARLTDRTRLVVFDHVTSPTAVIFPVRELISVCRQAGAQVLIDGAHAPGMLALDIPAIGADWYVGNCHKWLMAPRGSAFLWASPSAQSEVHPLVTSHGYGQGYTTEFDWTGTRDATAWLSIPAAIRLLEKLGGSGLRERNIALARAAATTLAKRLGTTRGTPDELTGSMATVRLDCALAATRDNALALRHELNAKHNIDAAVVAFADHLWLRLSAQAYNCAGDYRRLADAVLDIDPRP
jgi:isopenicillin-N epimerase